MPAKAILFVCGRPSCDGVRQKLISLGTDPGPCPGRRTLVQPSSTAICEGLTSMFSPFGFEVNRVFSGDEALRALVTQPAAVVVEADLKDGDGFELCRRIKLRQPELPVLVLSSMSANATGRERAAKAGATAFFRYPVEPQLLESAVWNMVGRPETRPAKEKRFLNLKRLVFDFDGD